MRVARILPLAAGALLLLGAAGTAHATSCGAPTLVTIDIGHTPRKGGATSARGVSEYAFNKRLAGFLERRLLNTDGFAVRVLNRAGKNISLGRRAAEIGRVRTGVLISIHHDSAQLRYFRKWTYKGKKRRYSDTFKGHSLFVSSRSPAYKQARDLGTALGTALRSAGFTPTLHHAEPIKGENRPLLNRSLGLYNFSGLRVLRAARVPAVLVEAGLIVNRQQELILGTEAFMETFTGTLISGIREYCRNASR